MISVPATFCSSGPRLTPRLGAMAKCDQGSLKLRQEEPWTPAQQDFGRELGQPAISSKRNEPHGAIVALTHGFLPRFKSTWLPDKHSTLTKTAKVLPNPRHRLLAASTHGVFRSARFPGELLRDASSIERQARTLGP